MKKLTLNERIEFATLELKDQGINLSEYHQPAEIENELNSHDVPQEMSFDDWNSFIKKHNPEMKILTLDERFLLLNGLILKEMNDWEKGRAEGWMDLEFRTYRFRDKNWYGKKASDEQIHFSLDVYHELPRYMTEEEYKKHPKYDFKNQISENI